MRIGHRFQFPLNFVKTQSPVVVGVEPYDRKTRLMSRDGQNLKGCSKIILNLHCLHVRKHGSETEPFFL